MEAYFELSFYKKLKSKTRTYLSYTANTMTADVLETQGARASAVVALV